MIITISQRQYSPFGGGGGSILEKGREVSTQRGGKGSYRRGRFLI